MSILGRRKKIRWDNIYKPYTERGHREFLLLLFKKPEPELIINIERKLANNSDSYPFQGTNILHKYKTLNFKCTWTNTSFKPKCVVLYQYFKNNIL